MQVRKAGFIFLLILSPSVSAQDFLNLGFEYIDDESGLPKNWIVTEENNCRIIPDTTMSFTDKTSLQLVSNSATPCSATILNVIKKELFKNKQRLKITAYVHSNKEPEAIHIISRQLTALGKEIKKPFNLNQPNQKENWFKLEFEQTIDEETEHLGVGFKASVNETTWIDKFEISFDDVKIIDGDPPSIPTPTEGELRWLNENIIPIKSVDPSVNPLDLLPLKEELKNNKIIALGEVTHGSSEIYKIKDRLIRFFCQNMNFSILAMEMDMTEAEKLNNYVLNGEGDPKELLLRTSYWPWQTEEFLELLKWMNDSNKSNNPKIQIVGFDLSVSNATLESVHSFASNYDDIFLRKADSIKYLFNNEYHKSQEIEKNKILINKLDNLLGYWRKEKEQNTLKNVTNQKHEWIDQSIITLKQGAMYYSGLGDRYYFRDSCMAENIKWILKTNPDAKVIFWAHNGHISKSAHSMGYFLNKRYPYFSIAFSMGSGFFNAVSKVNGYPTGARPSHLIPPVLDSYELYFSKSDSPTWFFNFKNLSKNMGDSQWLSGRHKFRFVGAVESPRYQFNYTKVIDDFDGLIFIRNSTPGQLLFQK